MYVYLLINFIFFLVHSYAYLSFIHANVNHQRKICISFSRISTKEQRKKKLKNHIFIGMIIGQHHKIYVSYSSWHVFTFTASIDIFIAKRVFFGVDSQFV